MNTIGIIGAMEEEVAILKEKMSDVTVLEKAGMEFYKGTLGGHPAVVVRSGIGKVNAGICTQMILKEKMSDVTVLEKAGMEFYKGTLGGHPAVVVRSGIGKVNAGICTQILADLFQVEAVINTGVAGSLKAEINIGDIVLSTDTMQHDVDAREFGYPLGQIPRMDTLTFPADEALRLFQVEAVINTGVAGSLKAEINIGDIVLSTDTMQHDVDAREFGYPLGHIPRMDTLTFPADEALRTAALKVCREVNPEIQVFEGRVASGDQFVADKETKDKIIANTQAYCTEMEGAAIGQQLI